PLNTAMWYTRIKTKANFDALGLSHEVKIKLDPIVYFTGISYKF
ncbi:OmpW family protein, partial [Glaesserella parasuis]|nr:OmpW family protein [Glaesserella parasuis]